MKEKRELMIIDFFSKDIIKRLFQILLKRNYLTYLDVFGSLIGNIEDEELGSRGADV